MSIKDLLVNVQVSEAKCPCHGYLRQIDAQLPNGKPIRIMESSDGFHVAIGEVNLIGEFYVPAPVSGHEVMRMIRSAL